MIRLRLTFPLLMMLSGGQAWSAEAALSEVDRSSFSAIVGDAAAAKALPWTLLLQQIATSPQLLDKPYEPYPLDRGSSGIDEPLRAGFDGFDCVTYVETVLALARSIALGQATPEGYTTQLARLRYREGQPGFCTRFHYFSDWADTQGEAGVLDEITVSVAGDPANLANLRLTHGFDYLSRNAAATLSLVQSPERQACVLDQERRLSERDDGTSYIRSTSLARVASELRAGDLIAWVADVPGLDVIHVGIVVTRANGRLELAQASKRNGRVIVTPDLLRYAASLRQQRGVRVFRPRDPRLAGP